ncbi:MAG: glycosyltransferase 87 family protein [Gordonia sp. (in: high G+C Gram-positive bacteria)]|uniref:glycosyltransferase 87 family protein n=1 Tax=Gordonia sp. (in: high G+C Gram-positive bacteria) TaxID=84139 RepID=UPI003BB5E47B
MADRPRTVPISVVWLAVALAVGALLWHLNVLPGLGRGYMLFSNGIDVKVYRGGGFAVLHGLPVYDEPVYKVWQFTYPPFAALGAAPLALLGIGATVHVMGVVNAIMLLTFMLLTLHCLGYARNWRFWCTGATLAVGVTLLQPIQTTIWNGQINLVLGVLVLGGLVLLPGRWRGLGIGLAGGIKLTPLFFLGYLAVTRQWKAAVVTVVTFAATVVIGLIGLRGQAVRFWTTTMRDTARIGPEKSAANQSINGFLHRLADLGLGQPPEWLWIPIGVLVGVGGLYAAWRAQRAGAVLLAITLTGMTTCAVSPFSWGHHWVWMAPLLVITLVQAASSARRGRPVTWLWWVLPPALLAVTFAWPVRRLGFEGRPMWGFGSYWWQWDVAASGWQRAGAVITSGAYLWVLLVTLAVTLWWCARRDPIRFTHNPPSDLPDLVR